MSLPLPYCEFIPLFSICEGASSDSLPSIPKEVEVQLISYLQKVLIISVDYGVDYDIRVKLRFVVNLKTH